MILSKTYFVAFKPFLCRNVEKEVEVKESPSSSGHQRYDAEEILGGLLVWWLGRRGWGSRSRRATGEYTPKTLGLRRYYLVSSCGTRSVVNPRSVWFIWWCPWELE